MQLSVSGHQSILIEHMFGQDSQQLTAISHQPEEEP
jgi:hypothetical protein